MRPIATKTFLLAGAALALTACGGAGPVADNAEDVTALPSVDNVAGGRDGVPSADGTAPANASMESAPSAPSGPVAPIPAVLHGEWGMTPGDCDVASGAAKGRLVVAANGLSFFESRAVPVANVETSPNSFSADFAFSGEGQTWKKYQALTLERDRLTRTESSPMASFIYARCD